MTTRQRKSLLCPSRAELAAEISKLFGRDAGQAVRYGSRFAGTGGVRADVPDEAWHPATQLTTPRGRKGGDDRGSAEDRRRRKRYLLDTWGDGFTAPCAFCKAELTYETLTVDRYPIPGHRGGRYTRDNIRPACGPCNSEDGGRQGAAIKAGANT